MKMKVSVQIYIEDTQDILMEVARLTKLIHMLHTQTSIINVHIGDFKI
jgi:hypothetical protein